MLNGRHALACIALLAYSQSASGAELLGDLNKRSTSAGSQSRIFVSLGTLALFHASDGRHGHEPWVTDGTSAGTRMLADIWPGATSSAPSPHFTVVGSVAYFTADDQTNFRELWVTDGTPSGTRIVANMTPNHIEDRNNPPTGYGGLASLNGQLVFQRKNELQRAELWRSNGTAQGTTRFFELPVSQVQAVTDLTAFGNRVYFRWHANDTGDEYWQTDGTTAGTRIVADLRPGSGSSSPGDLIILGASAYFLADDGNRGREFWHVPAAGVAPVVVPDLAPGGAGLNAVETVEFDGRLVVAAMSGAAAAGVHCLSGTSVTTIAPDGFRPVATTGGVYFFRRESSTLRLWVSNCTIAGTRQVSDLGTFSLASEIDAAAAGGNLVFRIDQIDGTGARLYGSDGTVVGTAQIALNGPRQPELPFAPFFSDGQSAYFLAEEILVNPFPEGSPPLTHSLWRTDGTPAGTARIASGFRKAEGIPLVAFHNGLLYLRVVDPAWGDEIFVSDGSPASWSLLRDTDPGVTTDSSMPGPALEADGYSYFVATEESDRRLWRTDGTPAGTVQIDLGGVSPSPFSRVVLGRRIVYLGSSEVTGFEPYAHDLDTGANQLLADIGPGQLSGSSGTCDNSLPVVGGRVLFNAFDGDRDGIFATDGTPAGTGRLLPVGSPMESLTICRWTHYGDGIVFSDARQSLWRTDGTEAGTVLVFDAGFLFWQPERLTVSNGVVYFSAPGISAPASRHLWRTDGTTQGTVEVANVPNGPINITPFGTLTAFRACEAPGGICNLHVTDGSPQGTRRISDAVVKGPSPEFPLPVWRGRIYVHGTDAQGTEPSNGIYSSDGNTLVRSVPLGFSFNEQFWPEYVFADRLIGLNPIFTVDVIRTFIRFDLWVSDGTSQGTRPLATFPGGKGIDAEQFTSSFSRPGAIRQLGSVLMFSADDGVHGVEPWTMPTTRPSASADSFAVPASGQSPLDVLANDGYLDSPLDPSTVEIVDSPRSGNATVNTSTGAILYTPNAGTAGMDELSYRVRDLQGAESNVAWVAVLVLRPQGPAPASPPVSPPPSPPPGGGSSSGGGGSADPSALVALLALWFAVGLSKRHLRLTVAANQVVAAPAAGYGGVASIMHTAPPLPRMMKRDRSGNTSMSIA